MIDILRTMQSIMQVITNDHILISCRFLLCMGLDEKIMFKKIKKENRNYQKKVSLKNYYSRISIFKVEFIPWDTLHLLKVIQNVLETYI